MFVVYSLLFSVEVGYLLFVIASLLFVVLRFDVSKFAVCCLFFCCSSLLVFISTRYMHAYRMVSTLFSVCCLHAVGRYLYAVYRFCCKVCGGCLQTVSKSERACKLDEVVDLYNNID